MTAVEATTAPTALSGTTFSQALAQLAAADPDRLAVTCGDESLTRRELDLRTNALARAYAEAGVTSGSFVTVGLPNGTEFAEAVVAVWKLGGIPQPISSRLPAAERRTILDLVRPALTVGVPEGEMGDRPCVPPGFTPPPGTSDAPLPPAVAPAWKAPTSGGSTGRPKVIVSQQPALLEQVAPYASLVGMRSEGVQLCTGPLHHNGPFMFSMVGLLTGGHLVVMPRFDAETALRLVDQHRVDWMYAVPTMMHRIWRLPAAVRTRYDLSSLRTVVHMAAPCPIWLKRAWIDWLGPDRLLELYAGTEAQAATVITGEEWLAHPGSVGRPVLGEIAVLDDEGNEAPPYVPGRIWMRRDAGGTATYRYVGAAPVGRPGGWETLGDLGYRDGDGYLYLTDRESDMLLVGGANVYPAEVEAALDQHHAVVSSCVVGLPDDDLGTVPHAVVQTLADVTDEELRAHCARLLAPYKVPRSFSRSDTALRDDGGKVRRSAVRDAILAAEPRLPVSEQSST
jgi:bile acid-coenzyme A ligase